MKRRNSHLGFWTCLIPLMVIPSLAGTLAQQPSEEERIDYYQRWLERDVVYIVSEEERAVFEKLTTPEEKDSFIEQFWLRRDSNPSTSINEFKEEHYRRIAYANERFAAGIDGWATDRGRIYIKFGPPKTIDRNPTGEIYLRNAAEGGGETTTYPYETWYYEYIEGIGSGISLEFVDRGFSGDYRLALHPYEKDALLDKPGAGLTHAEAEGIISKRARLDALFMQRPSYREGHTWADRTRQPFESLQTYFDLRRPPEFKYDDLRQVVDARITYGPTRDLATEFTYQYFYLDPKHALVPVCFGFRLGDLIPRTDEFGNMNVKVNIYGRITDLTHRVHYEFEDSLDQSVSMGEDPDMLYLYEKRLPVTPGRYKLTAVLKEEASQRMTILEQSLYIPELNPERLALGSINLLTGLRRVDPEVTLSESFLMMAGLKGYPDVDRQVDKKNKVLGIHFEIYNFALAQDHLLPDITGRLVIYDRQGQKVLAEELPASSLTLLGTKMVALHELDLSGFAIGEYKIEVSAYDRIKDEEIVQTAHFSVTDLAGDGSGA